MTSETVINDAALIRVVPTGGALGEEMQGLDLRSPLSHEVVVGYTVCRPRL